MHSLSRIHQTGPALGRVYVHARAHGRARTCACTTEQPGQTAAEKRATPIACTRRGSPCGVFYTRFPKVNPFTAPATYIQRDGLHRRPRTGPALCGTIYRALSQHATEQPLVANSSRPAYKYGSSRERKILPRESCFLAERSATVQPRFFSEVLRSTVASLLLVESLFELGVSVPMELVRFSLAELGFTVWNVCLGVMEIRDIV